MVKKIFVSAALTVLAQNLSTTYAQQIANVGEDYNLLQHGIEQFEGGHFVQAIHSLERYLAMNSLPTQLGAMQLKPHQNYDMATYYLTLAKILYGTEGAASIGEEYINNSVNPTYRERVAYHLARYFFNKKDYSKAITYYEVAGINSLNNIEIASAKFELAYSYFVNNDFNRAYPLFASIKEIEQGRYYNQGNYYYGIIAYNKKEYDQALRSFDRIYHLPEYEDIIPYYIAEIHYLRGEKEKVLDFAHRYLDREKKLYYHKELNQLVGQVYYDQGRYKLALPYLEYYYDNSDKIRRENLYQLAHTHYQIEDYTKAITFFKPLSNIDDSIGHHSMYLLADAYLKNNDKNGARNAYAIAAGMNAFPKLKQDAAYNYAILSNELGNRDVAIQALNNYINDYPNAANNNTAKELLITLLANSANHNAAYDILSKMNINTQSLKKIYQQVALSNGINEYRKGNKVNALRLINESLQYPENADVRAVAQFWKSHISYSDGKYNEAAQLMNAFISKAETSENTIRTISPEATLNNAYTHLGYTEMKLEQYDNARKSFTLAGNRVASASALDKEAKINTLLQADAAFMNKNYKEAEILYDKALTQNIPNPDYAIYQKATIAGILGSADRKINLLRSIKKDYPKGKSYNQANYELANALIEIGQKSEAITIYNQIATDNENPYQKDAIYKIGVTEINNNNPQRGITYLKNYITTYPNGKDYTAALNTLRGLYVQQGTPGAYYDFLKEKNVVEPQGMSNQELAFYEAAETKYSDEEYSAAITQFTNYIEAFPKGNNIQQAYFFRAESKKALNIDSLGIKDYLKVINIDNESEYANLSLKRIASIYKEYKEYDGANDALGLLILRTNNKEELLASHYSLLENYDAMNKFENAQSSIDFINANNTLLNTEQKEYLQLINGKRMLSSNDFIKAEEAFSSIKDKGNNELHAQAKYYYALALYRQGKLVPAEAAADESISKNQNHSLWLEKSYVLIAEILLAQKDYFNARATLQSVIKNARNKNIADEAKIVLEQVNIQEEANGKVIKE